MSRTVFCPSRVIAVASFAVAILLGCQDLVNAKRPYSVYAQSEEAYQPIVNDVKPETADRPVLVLKNDSYPIELALFKNGHFSYYLKNLKNNQAGLGTWSYDEGEGYLKLYAERKMFVMQMAIRSLHASDAEALTLEFSDRFGPKYLPLVQVAEIYDWK